MTLNPHLAFEAAVRGVCPVLEVPFDEDGAVDVPGFDRVVDHVLASGVTSVVWPGFASEFYKLTDAERTLLRGHLLGRVQGHERIHAVIGVAQHSTRVAVAEAVAAAEAGAGALNVLPPYFLVPAREAVLDHLRAILAAVSPLPVIVQYAPSLAPSAIGAADLCHLAGEQPNLRMVKVDSASAGRLIGQLGHADPPLLTMVGYAGITMIDSLRRGASGVQPGCSAVEVYQRIWQLWCEGRTDEAEGLHRRLLPYVVAWMQEMELIIQVEKTVSKERGWIGSDYCRAPGRRLDDAERESIARFLAEFGELLAA